MHAKKYLEKVRIKREALNRKLDELDRLKEIVTTITVTLREEGAVSGSGPMDRIGTCASAMIDLENEINKKYIELNALESEVLHKLSELHEREQVLLYKRYFEYKTWGTVAKEMRYSRQWAYEANKIALKKLEKILKK